MDLVSLVVIALATARLTRLVTEDRITERLRLWVMTRVDEDGELAYLLHCPWCVSMYVAPVVAVLAYLYGDSAAFSIPALALAASHVTGWLAAKTED